MTKHHKRAKGLEGRDHLCLPVPKGKGSTSIIVMAAGRLQEQQLRADLLIHTQEAEREHIGNGSSKDPHPSVTHFLQQGPPCWTPKEFQLGIKYSDIWTYSHSDHRIRVSRYSSQSLPIQCMPSHLLLYGFKKPKFTKPLGPSVFSSHAHTPWPGPPHFPLWYTPRNLPLYALTNPHLLMTSGFKLQLHWLSVLFVWHTMHCFLSLL